MRTLWVSYDLIGRACLGAAVGAGADVVGIVTLSRRVGRNRSGVCSFEEIAHDLGAELIDTDDINERATLARVGELEPEMAFVIGWPQLVSDRFIQLAPRGVFGMHPTLLPRHRGRAPIPWTILSGLARTGVTLFEIADGTADSGPIVGQLEVAVDPCETAGTLYEKITAAHVEVLSSLMPALLAGEAPRKPQDPARASTWPKRMPADGIIDWETRASYLYDWVRAQTRPYPGAFTQLHGEKVIVWRARPVESEVVARGGTVLALNGQGVVVACGEGALLLEEAEPKDVLGRVRAGDRFG